MLTGKKLRSFLAYAVHDVKTPLAETPRKPPIRAKRATPRRGPERDAKYRAFIRTLACLGCGIEGRSEAAHTDVLPETSAKGGMSMKHSDYSCVPLCHACHQSRPDSYHRIGRDAFERAHGVNFADAVTRLRAEWRKLTEAA